YCIFFEDTIKNLNKNYKKRESIFR
ncbi:uncharacterized protein METZ01_LOCUS451299, partial [marine metagenome]